MYETVKLSPVFKDYLWGGRKLVKDFNKKCYLEKAAESWELSTHKDGESIVASGEFSGKKLSEYINLSKDEILGKRAASFEFFPILIKFIDAHDSLSIQVHPDDEYALKNEGEYGKTEMWYILDCDEDAFIYYGFKNEISKEEFETRIKENTLLDVLNKVPVKKGDVFFIKSGTVHAIGKGNVICEIQQNSNTTYRVYDYDRRDKDGNTRPLHIDKAIDCATLAPPENFVCKKSEKGPNMQRKTLAECKYFTVEEVYTEGQSELSTAIDTFHSITVFDGEGEVKTGDTVISVMKGDTLFVPAGYDKIEINGKIRAVLSYV